MTVNTLLKEARKMDLDKRTILAHMIWDSVEDDCEDAELTDEQKRELERRMELDRKHPQRGIPFEEVMRRLDRLYPVRLTRAQKEVLADRLDEIDKHPERGIPWTEARKRFRQRR